jgi:molybdopterin synthase sulfur carrier subunit
MQIAQITVRYFASIREQLGRQEDRLEAAGIACVADIWQQVAMNQEYARPETAVQAGDEVAFFPPVTGG